MNDIDNLLLTIDTSLLGDEDVKDLTLNVKIYEDSCNLLECHKKIMIETMFMIFLIFFVMNGVIQRSIATILLIKLAFDVARVIVVILFNRMLSTNVELNVNTLREKIEINSR